MRKTPVEAILSHPWNRAQRTPAPIAQCAENSPACHCSRQVPRADKAPKSVVFGPLPTTATGKIQKFVLRERARTI